MMTDKDLLRALDDLKYRLNYLHNRNLELEKENEYLKEAYENRVNEYLKLKNKAIGHINCCKSDEGTLSKDEIRYLLEILKEGE